MLAGKGSVWRTDQGTLAGKACSKAAGFLTLAGKGWNGGRPKFCLPARLSARTWLVLACREGLSPRTGGSGRWGNGDASGPAGSSFVDTSHLTYEAAGGNQRVPAV
jgi:hypothetical protein